MASRDSSTVRVAGLRLIAIPGLGPIVAAGWLISTVAGAGIGAAGGAATGGIVGALKTAGHTDEEANVYAESVGRGGTLVSARVPDGQAAEAEAVLNRHNAAEAGARGREYKEGGWTGFDENVHRETGETSTAEPLQRPGVTRL